MTNTIDKQKLLNNLDLRIQRTLNMRAEDEAHYEYYTGVYATLALLYDAIDEGQFDEEA